MSGGNTAKIFIMVKSITNTSVYKYAKYISIGFLVIFISCNQSPNKENNAKESLNYHITGEQQSDPFAGNRELKSLPVELAKFIPQNYSLLDTASGDLNFDKIPDMILVLRENIEDTLTEITEIPVKRPLLILIRNADNELKSVRKNENTVYCLTCGGIMGDPFTGITIKDGYFTVEHYAGSAWRWTRDLTYTYSKPDREWYLFKEVSESFHISIPDKKKITIRTTKDFGKVKFEDFDIYKNE